MGFVYIYPAPDSATECELREQLTANGFEPLYVRVIDRGVQFAMADALTPAQETAIGNAILNYDWSSRRELLKARVSDAENAIKVVPPGVARDAIEALLKLIYVLFRG